MGSLSPASRCGGVDPFRHRVTRPKRTRCHAWLISDIDLPCAATFDLGALKVECDERTFE